MSSNRTRWGSLSAIPPGPKFKKRGVQNSTPQNWGAEAAGKNFEVGIPADAHSAILSEIT